MFLFSGMGRPLLHTVMDDSDGDTIPSETSRCARRRDLCFSATPPPVYIFDPDTVHFGFLKGRAAHSEPSSSSTEEMGFSPLLRSPSWPSPDVSELLPAPTSQDVSILCSTVF